MENDRTEKEMKSEPGGETTFLVRLSAELSTKARGTRRRFTRKLVDNVRAGFRARRARARVEDQWNRLVVTTPDPDAAEVMTRIPGISSFSRVEQRCDATLDAILDTGVRLFGEAVKGRTFAVRARRSGKHAFSSHDIHMRLGAALNPGATVDLDDPEVVVEVEVRDFFAYFFSGRTPGLGGLPLGVEGRALCLLSGGFDSAVAAHLILKRGVELDYVFCNMAGDAYERSVVLVGKVLAEEWSFGTRPRLFAIDFSAPVDELRARTQPKYWQLLLKRLMYRAAVQIADEVGASAIVTGEAIGQVSSQTLANLAAIEPASDRPVLRPLLGFDKPEIIELSRKVGTFELSSKVKEYCAIAPGNPVTHAKPRVAEEEEAKLDLEVLRRATAERKMIDLLEVNAADLVEQYLFTDSIPEGARLLDVRTEAEWDDWHHPAAEHHDFWEISSNPKGLDRDGTYVVYCDAGLQAAQLAEKLQRQGVEAYAFRGGTRALRRLQEGGGP
jgi:tRNA uracil 4-sulfurtransferase